MSLTFLIALLFAGVTARWGVRRMNKPELFDDAELLGAATPAPVSRADAKEAQADRLRALTVQGYIVRNGTSVTVFRDFGGLLVRWKIEYLAGVPGCRVLQRDAM